MIVTLSVHAPEQNAAQGPCLLISKILKLGFVAEALNVSVVVVLVVVFNQLWSSASPVPFVGSAAKVPSL